MTTDTVSAGEDGFHRVPAEMADRLHQLFPGEYENFYTWAGRTWPVYGLASASMTHGSAGEQPR